MLIKKLTMDTLKTRVDSQDYVDTLHLLRGTSHFHEWHMLIASKRAVNVRGNERYKSAMRWKLRNMSADHIAVVNEEFNWAFFRAVNALIDEGWRHIVLDNRIQFIIVDCACAA